MGMSQALTWRDDAWGDDYRDYDQPRTEKRYTAMSPIEALQSYARFRSAVFRPYQEQAIRFIQQCDRKVIVLESPTGSGKSIIGACAGKMLGSLTYLCHSKVLQEQLATDFPDFKILMGRNNYQCGRAPLLKADECNFKECWNSCPYNVQKRKTLNARLRVLNYAYFLTEANGPGKFSGFDFMVCDEADILENILSGYVSLEFTERMLQDLKIDPPRYKTTSSEKSIPEWKRWAADALSKTLNKIFELEKKVDQDGDDEEDEFGQTESDYAAAIHKDIKRFKRFESKLMLFHTHVDKSWLQKEDDTRFGHKWVFEPLWVNEDITEQYFLRHVERKIVLMSATFPPIRVLSKILGIPMKMMDYMQIPSTFDPVRRPVYIQPAGCLNQKTFDVDVSRVIEKVDQILEHYAEQKGLIHCVSYKLMREIYDNSEYQYRLLYHTQFNRMEMLEQFKASDEPVVLLSPSMERGVSLNDDLARFIIIAKCPYESLADKRTSQRLYSGFIGQHWYTAMTAQNIIQMAGRGMRHADDQCDVYIVDQAAKDLILKNVKLFPEYFRDAIEL